MSNAIFTIVHNEKYFLPIWLRYYSQYFDNNDIYVLNHDSTDGSTDNLPCNVIPIHHETCFDHQWLLDQVQSFQRNLLQQYEIVVFAEIDEILLPNPQKYTLTSYLNNMTEPAITAVGKDIYHYDEPDIDLNQPILQQRKYWIHNDAYSKTLISKIPLYWVYGFHRSLAPYPQDTDLYLIHLQKMDFILSFRRKLERLKKPWCNQHEWLGAQNHTTTVEEHKKFFEVNELFLEIIPEFVKQVSI